MAPQHNVGLIFRSGWALSRGRPTSTTINKQLKLIYILPNVIPDFGDEQKYPFIIISKKAVQRIMFLVGQPLHLNVFINFQRCRNEILLLRVSAV